MGDGRRGADRPTRDYRTTDHRTMYYRTTDCDWDWIFHNSKLICLFTMYGVTKAVTVCTRLKKEVRTPKLYRLFTDLTG